MMVLTPAERRAVQLLVLLLALGAASDLISGRGATRTRRHSSQADTASDAARGSGNPSPAAPALAKGTAGETLDLNRATASQLDGLPGVGPVLAARILEQRRTFGSFRAIEDLRAVRGIGPRLFERLRSRVHVGPVPGDSSSQPAPGGPGSP